MPPMGSDQGACGLLLLSNHISNYQHPSKLDTYKLNTHTLNIYKLNLLSNHISNYQHPSKLNIYKLNTYKLNLQTEPDVTSG